MTLGSRSTKRALGTCFPVPVVEKNVEKESSYSPVLSWSTIIPSGPIPCSRQYSSLHMDRRQRDNPSPLLRILPASVPHLTARLTHVNIDDFSHSLLSVVTPSPQHSTYCPHCIGNIVTTTTNYSQENVQLFIDELILESKKRTTSSLVKQLNISARVSFAVPRNIFSLHLLHFSFLFSISIKESLNLSCSISPL